MIAYIGAARNLGCATIRVALGIALYPGRNTVIFPPGGGRNDDFRRDVKFYGTCDLPTGSLEEPEREGTSLKVRESCWTACN